MLNPLSSYGKWMKIIALLVAHLKFRVLIFVITSGRRCNKNTPTHQRFEIVPLDASRGERALGQAGARGWLRACAAASGDASCAPAWRPPRPQTRDAEWAVWTPCTPYYYSPLSALV